MFLRGYFGFFNKINIEKMGTHAFKHFCLALNKSRKYFCFLKSFLRQKMFKKKPSVELMVLINTNLDFILKCNFLS
ncbi:MAG: hypothetical protein ACI9WT_000925 [Flavobacterium sp.]|jgi:hypothetical protein